MTELDIAVRAFSMYEALLKVGFNENQCLGLISQYIAQLSMQVVLREEAEFKQVTKEVSGA